MNNYAVLGLQWGDEGKGKIIDFIADKFDAVVRYQGGSNAGHTLVLEGKTHKLSVLPSGVLHNNTTLVIGNEVAFNPELFLSEVNSFFSKQKKDIFVSAECSVILQIHRDLDCVYEKLLDNNKIGTTKHGIGPCYEDRVSRRGLRLCDLYKSDASLLCQVKCLVCYHSILRSHFDLKQINTTTFMDYLLFLRDALKEYIFPYQVIREKLQNKRLLFEGAQGVLLDLNLGTYPFVTSSSIIPNTVVSGIGKVGRVLGVFKAYSTRVGEGPFPSEESTAVGALLQTKGNEFGTVSGRSRRCGWVDLVTLKNSIEVAGVSELAITKLDVLSGLESIKICIAYKINGQVYHYLPPILDPEDIIEPVYEEIEGWPIIEHTDKLEDLHINTKRYIAIIERILERKVSIISIGPSRKETLVLSSI